MIDETSKLLDDIAQRREARIMRRFYGVSLSDRRAVARFQLYEIVEGRLKTVTPADRHMCSRATLLPCQVFSLREGYPAFHFRIDNPTAIWLREFEDTLARKLGYDIEIIWLNGEEIHA